MKKKKTIWVWSVIAVMLIAVAAIFVFKNKEITLIESDKAIKRTIVKTVSASGVIEPVKKVNISSSISANIIQLLVKEGQSVKKGDLLARLDRETITAEVEQQTAALSQQRYSSNTALLQMKQIQLDFDNKVKLKENNFISDNDFDNTKLSLDIAKTNYESSLENIKLQTAYLDQAKDKLNKTNIYAPLDGSIIKLYKEQGEMVLGSQFNNDIILSIADLNAFKVNVKVDENDVALISVADSVKITIDAMGEMIFKGTVTEIGNTPLNVGSTESSIEYNVSVDMITKDDRIKPGMTTYAEIITDIVKDVLSVPIQSLARRKKSEIDKDSTDTKIENSNIDWRKKSDYYDVIFRLNKKDKAEDKVYEVEMVKIKTGIANDRYIEITEGLNENDLIVSGDYQTISKVLKDGMTVKEK